MEVHVFDKQQQLESNIGNKIRQLEQNLQRGKENREFYINQFSAIGDIVFEQNGGNIREKNDAFNKLAVFLDDRRNPDTIRILALPLIARFLETADNSSIVEYIRHIFKIYPLAISLALINQRMSSNTSPLSETTITGIVGKIEEIYIEKGRNNLPYKRGKNIRYANSIIDEKNYPFINRAGEEVLVNERSGLQRFQQLSGVKDNPWLNDPNWLLNQVSYINMPNRRYRPWNF